MSLLQVLLQQLGRPDRGMITGLAGIAGQGRRDQGVDDLGDRRRAARPRGVEQARLRSRPSRRRKRLAQL